MNGKIEIKRGAATVVSINPLQNSAYTRGVMGEETVTLSWEQSAYVELKVGDKIMHDAVTFTLNQLPTVKKQSKNNYRYDAVFQSPLYELLKVTYLLFDGTNTIPQGDFSLTGEPQAFVNLLVQNLNRVGTGWTAGSVAAAEAKTLSFSNENCFAVLSKLAQEFETEFSVDGKTVHLNKITRVANLTLEYGSTLYDIERKTVDSADVVTRLYPFGGNRNLKADYRGGSERLLIPAPAKYLELHTDKYGIIEGTKTFEEIYPRLKAGAGLAGTVTAVSDIFTFSDSNLDFDINSFLLPGTPAKVKFISGACAGYECEIKKYLNASKTLTIIANEDDKGWMIPQQNIKPAVGDKYVLLDIAMPPAYVARAEQELLDKATQYLQENSQPKVSYTVTISALYAKQNGVDLRPGDLVAVKDVELGVNTQLRVIKVTSEIKENYNIKIDLSDTVSKGTLARIADELEENKAGVKAANKGVSQAFSRSWRDVQELSGLIDTLRADMLVVGNTQGQFSIKNTLFTPNYSNDKNKFYATPGQLLHRTVPEGAPGTWDFPAYAPTLADDAKPYFLYAKCSRTTAAGVYYFSEDSIKYDSNAADWYFLIGVLSSVNAGTRAFQTTYGFTQITGSSIVTGKIQSPTGGVYIDLDKNNGEGEIGGKIVFKSGSTGLENIPAFVQTKDKIDNLKIGIKNILIDSSFSRGVLMVESKSNINCSISNQDTDGNQYVRNILRMDNFSSLQEIDHYCYLNNQTPVFKDKEYVFSFKYKCAGSIVGNSSYLLLNGTHYLVNITFHPNAQEYLGTFKFKSPYSGNLKIRFGFVTAQNEAAWLNVYDQMIVEGNTAPDSWTEASEDIQERIVQAKQTGLDAQNAVNTTNQNVTNLNGYVNGAFKDGIIQNAEKVAIEKYLNTVSESRLSIQSSYSQLYNNSYLEGTPKSNLESAKTTFETAVTNLVNSINTAIADGATTPVEKADVDAKFNLYNTALATYQVRVEEAKKAIEDKLKGYADAAQQTANNALVKATTVEATANKSKAITDKFGTTVEGGLVQSVMMLLRELNSQIETAGISGIQGDGTKPAFWAGGTYAQALAGLAKIILRHNGSAKIGIFNVDNVTESVYVYDKDVEGLIRLLISNLPLPTAEELNNANMETHSVSCADYSLSGQTPEFIREYAETIEVTASNSRLNFKGNITAYAANTMDGSSAQLLLYKKTGATFQFMTSISGYGSTGSTDTNYTLDKTFKNLPLGIYKMALKIRIPVSGGFSFRNMVMNFEKDIDIRRVEFARNGFMMHYRTTTATRTFRMTEEEGLTIDGANIKGKITAKCASNEYDVPGVLATGSVDRYGGHSNVWGAKAATSQQTITKGNGAGQITGIYNIPHNINRTNYTAIATSASDDVDARIIVKAANYIRVHVKSVIGAFVDAGFDYQITGSNY